MYFKCTRTHTHETQTNRILSIDFELIRGLYCEQNSMCLRMNFPIHIFAKICKIETVKIEWQSVGSLCSFVRASLMCRHHISWLVMYSKLGSYSDNVPMWLHWLHYSTILLCWMHLNAMIGFTKSKKCVLVWAHWATAGSKESNQIKLWSSVHLQYNNNSMERHNIYLYFSLVYGSSIRGVHVFRFAVRLGVTYDWPLAFGHKSRKFRRIIPQHARAVNRSTLICHALRQFMADLAIRLAFWRRHVIIEWHFVFLSIFAPIIIIITIIV